LAVTVVIAQ